MKKIRVYCPCGWHGRRSTDLYRNCPRCQTRRISRQSFMRKMLDKGDHGWGLKK